MTISAGILWFVGLVPTVTPVDRMRAMKSLNTEASGNIPWPALIGSIAIVVLLILLVAVNRNVTRKKQEREAAEFDTRADNAGLTAAERRLMSAIARYAGVAEESVVFSDHEAFCRGAARMMQERFSAGDSIEDRRSMKTVIESVYQKLGIVSSAPSSTSNSLNSRQIPVGRQIFVTRSNGDSSETIEATVTGNRYDGLAIRLSTETPVTKGDKWRLKYNFGSSTLEFETAVIGFDDGAVTLAHRELARSANRRRFLRVAVDGRALVANCPFRADETSLHKATPKFVNAQVTEIAGPGLRLETSLSVQMGDKLMVIAIFDGGETIRAIGEVRHTKPSKAGSSVAIEFTGLSDEEIGVMVRLTNMAARRAGVDEAVAVQEQPVAGGRA